MCGISGIINFNNKLSIESLVKFNTIIKHRGPDDEGYWLNFEDNSSLHCFGKDTNKDTLKSSHVYSPKTDIKSLYKNTNFNVGLGHRRLSIIDLSSCGHQPISSQNKDIILTYNGEIYNFIELKKELEKLGCKFKTKTDTEVIIHAYKKWGINCLSKFNGMFAFILYDKSRNKLFAVRDRFGIKPLYYQNNKDAFISFASEIKQFTTLPGWGANLNHNTAEVFLSSGIGDYSEETMFDSIYQIPGGSYAQVDVKSGAFKVIKWYELRKTKLNISYEDAVEKFRDLFKKSVSLRLHADVNVGTGLSGGLDSSSIVCTSNKLIKDKKSHYTFSSRSTDKNLDEGSYIKEVVQNTKFKNYEVWPSIKELQDEMDKVIWHQDEPFSGTSVFAEWKIYELVKSKGVKVTLEGHAADEILLGYHYNFKTYQAQLLNDYNFLAFIKSIFYLKKHFGFSYKKSFLSLIFLLIPKKFITLFKNYIKGSTSSKTKLLKKSRFSKTKKAYKKLHQKNLQAASYMQLLHVSLPFQLHWADRDSMANSIEARVPFLDYRVIEFLYNLPTHYKFDGAVTKRILRDAMDGILPDKIKNRKSKIGFATPEEQWAKENAEFFKKELNKIKVQYAELFSEDLFCYLGEIIAGIKPYDPILWRVICFGRWLEIYKVSVK